LLAFNFFNGNPIAIDHIDGIILLVIFALFIYISFVRDRKNSAAATATTEEKPQNIWISLLRTFGGLGVLIIGCDYFIDAAVAIATQWGVNEAFISITLIACGTSMPELAASVAAAAKRNTDLALGNIVGSNIFNLSFILGVSSQINVLAGGGITVADYSVMIASAVLLLICALNKKISRFEGAILFAAFVTYNVYLISTQTL
ncbi:MAG: sodium:calcium antiporter, partial [Alistipes sp.]|nr:sodium:calcium antiporter [Alistipes sp.]